MPSSETPSSDQDLDHELMARIASGNQDAFKQLVLRHQDGLINFSYSMTQNHAEAEDIAQQTFLRIWKHAANYEPQGKFTSYLFTIAKRLVFNESRRKSRKPEQSFEQYTEEHHHEPVASETASPDEVLLDSEMQEVIEKALSALPEQQRMILTLRRHEGLSYEEIAIVLETSLSAVKSHLFRARSTLREQLSRYLDT